MLKLVIGGACSGKSDFAQELIKKDCLREEGNLIYLATMTAKDRESLEGIKRHRKNRKDFGFRTIEMGVDISRAAALISGKDLVLIEDIPNLVANEFFREGSNIHTTPCPSESFGFVDFLVGEIEKLAGGCREIVAVTGDLFSDGAIYEEVTDRYLRCLAAVNYRLAMKSSYVCEVVCGMENRLKDLNGR